MMKGQVGGLPVAPLIVRLFFTSRWRYLQLHVFVCLRAVVAYCYVKIKAHRVAVYVYGISLIR